MRLLFLSPVLLLAACGGGGYYGNSDLAWNAGDLASGFRCFGSNDCAPGQMCNTFGQCVDIPVGRDAGAPPPTPPEVENRPEAPASGKRFVYVTVAAANTVVKIDSQTLQVRTIDVGKDPSALRTVQGQDLAVVLNRGSATATILRSRDDGTDAIITVPTAAGLNSIAMSPDGRHALAWFDLIATGGVVPPKQSFQDVTVIALEAGKELSVDLSVGFRPSEVQFAPDGSAAYVITDEGISIIPLVQTPKPAIVPSVALRKDPVAEPIPSEVEVTPDGKLALVRLPKVQGFRSVDLKTKAIADFSLAGEPTDLDISVDGTLAVLVLRDANEVVFVDIPADLADPTGMEKLSTQGYLIGQSELTRDNAHALLFTNATTQKAVLLADLKLRSIAVYPLKKGVRAVLPSPDGQAAVLVHNKVPGTPSPQDDLDTFLDKLQGYSLFEVKSGFAKLLPTDASPGPTAFAPDSLSAYLLLNDPQNAVRSVEAIDLTSFLVTSVALGSPPVAVGVVPMTHQVYVGQTHALGRMTFVDTEHFKTRTLTGFGLNGQIIE